MDLTKLTLGERIVLVAGALLIIDLLFLPWYSIDLGGLNIPGLDTTRSSIQAPYAIYGVVALLAAIVMVGQIVAAKIMSATLPAPPVPWSQVHLIAAGVIVGALVVKFIAETSSLGFGCYLGLALAAAIAYGAYANKQTAPA